MKNKENKSEFIIFRVTIEEKINFKKEAKDSGQNVSKIIRKKLNLDEK